MHSHSRKSLPGLERIKDERVLAALRHVARERFVPDDMKPHAYEDRALPIGFGQSISQPYIVALMSELLALKGTERVLEVGTGSGYQTAVLAELVKEVYSIEIIPELIGLATPRFIEMGYKNIQVRIGDGYQGWPEASPFDGIIVTCSPDHVPQPLVDQLAEGGRLVIPVGPWPREQMLHQFQKVRGELTKRPVIPVSFVPMTGELQ